MSAFYQLHRDLPREGPGTPDDVRWALDVARTPASAAICDAACGPGADTVTLADTRPAARIVAVDKTAHFVAAARARLAHFGDRVAVRQGDIADLDGAFDLIWCAGALYFIGVTAGLQAWRGALRPGARVAFSEPCLVATPASPTARAFWADYPALTDLAGIKALVRAAGYDVLDHRMVIGDGWEAYYAPMRKRIAALRGTGDAALELALDEASAEIALWARARQDIAYALLVVAPG